MTPITGAATARFAATLSHITFYLFFQVCCQHGQPACFCYV
jgi:hypothetical protein